MSKAPLGILCALLCSYLASCGNADPQLHALNVDGFPSDVQIREALEPTPSANLRFVARTPTQYPLVLAHGLGASARLFSFEPIAENLRAHGYTVFVTEVSAFDSIEKRGGQLAVQIDKILNDTGAEKVNLVGHSMGGLDSRFVVSGLGYSNRVSSLSTIATPHRGSPTADKALSDLKAMPWQAPFILWLIGRVTALYNLSTDYNTADVGKALLCLSIPYMGTFNSQYPDAPSVYYQSWAGETSLGGGKDTVNILLREPYKTIFAAQGANDGLVSVHSARWGNFRGTLDADHLDQIGLGPLEFSAWFNYQEFYLELAEDLAQRGF